MNRNERKFLSFVIFVFLILLYLGLSSVAQAQYWAALPPYNTLWPLWSPALSPVDSGTGLAVPIVDSLSPDTYCLFSQDLLGTHPGPIRGFCTIPHPGSATLIRSTVSMHGRRNTL